MTVDIDKRKDELLTYVKKEVDKKHYPTRRHIQNKLGYDVIPMFKSISDLYSKAGIEYKQEISQELKNKKAELLTNIATSFLPKLGLELLEVRGVHDKGVDMIAINYQGKIIGIEIKAHNKYEPIKRSNFLQLIRFLKKEKLHKVILMTTTSRFENNLDKRHNIEFIYYEKLKKLCTDSQLAQLNYIRDTSVHIKTNERIFKKQKIIDYTKRILSKNEDITYNKILKNLNLDAYTYFSTINDIYTEAGLLPPLGKIGGRRNKKFGKYYITIINKMLEYIKREIAKGYYPTGIDVGRKFKVKHIWNFVTMTELYQRLGIDTYHKRKPRFKMVKIKYMR